MLKSPLQYQDNQDQPQFQQLAQTTPLRQTLHLKKNKSKKNQHLHQNQSPSYAQQTISNISPSYSLTRNSFSSTVATAKLNGKGKHITHTKQGEVTRQGLYKGYIQSSPFYPETNLYICMEEEIVYVKGKARNGTKINKAFAKIAEARTYLYSKH